MAWIVYELANPELKETYLSCTDRPLQDEIARNRRQPPQSIAHWKLEHRRYPRIHDVFQERDEAMSRLQGLWGERRDRRVVCDLFRPPDSAGPSGPRMQR